jgi:formylglycine-generating enzyme required for sulfatase activity
VSSINQAKAEARKLIKQYQKLQSEAQTAATAEEAALKAAETKKLVSQISTLQSTISKLGKEQTTALEEQKLKRATSFEDRINHLEEAQKKTRTQIEQLNRAKEQLTGLLKREKEKNARAAVHGSRTNDEKLQQELTQLISKKEAEQRALRQELDKAREHARKEAELFKVQRDAARALMDKQKQLERERSNTSPNYSGNKGLLMGIAIGGVFSLLLGGIFLVPLLTQQPVEPQNPVYEAPATTQPTDRLFVEKEPPEVMPSVKPLGRYRDSLKQGGKGPLMVKLPSGTFKMGSKNSLPYHDERPQHEVTLRAFSISRYEVTFEEYDRFARATGSPLPDDRGWGRGKRPVINVNWHEATKYTKWLTDQTGHQYQLPSEREWEYAATAGTDTNYWWGIRVGENNANCGICDSQWDGKKTAPVGSFKPNAFEIYDTIGNVMEWTRSCLRRSYQGAPATGNQWRGGDCSQRMVRSSSYRSYINSLRTTKRNHFHPNTRIDTLGFRVVRVD